MSYTSPIRAHAMIPGSVRALVASVIVGAAYLVVGKFAIHLPILHSNVSPVWPPAGIALAAFLIFGYRIWPGVLLGAFLIDVSSPATIAASIGIAAGNTLQPLLGAYFVNRFAAGCNAFERSHNVFRFAMLAGVATTAISAIFGVTSLSLAGLAPWPEYASLWLTWWLADIAGSLVVAPALVLWAKDWRFPSAPGRLFEALLLVLSVSLISMIVFGGFLVHSHEHLTFLCVLPLLWAAFRFGPREAATTCLLLSAITVWGNMRHLGPFTTESPRESLLLLQAFLCTIAVTTLAVAATVRERKRAEQERTDLLAREQRARSEAEAANRLKDEFLATVSHELRTPLTAILGWARMLRSGAIHGPTEAEALEVIERNARLQAKLVEDILDASRIVAGKLRLNLASVDVHELLEQSIETLRLVLDAKAIRLETAFDGSPRPILADPHRLQQIFDNLLSNAIKFTPRGGRIDATCRYPGGSAEITIRDTGQGISPEFLPYIFDPFRQADASAARRQGGLGLGLAIVRHLTELHGGAVSAESPGPGRGATFTVKLPLPAAAPMPPQPAAASAGSYLLLKGINVLVLEDDRDTRNMLACLLGRCGAEVVTAGSSAEALRLLDHASVHVLIVDIGLPGEDGYTFLRKVRSLRSRAAATPAIALTALARPEDRDKALSAGFEVHIAKPVQPEDLTSAIARVARPAVVRSQATS